MRNLFRRGLIRKKRRICYKNYRHHEEILNINEISYKDFLKKIKEGGILIDVRSKQEFLEGHLDGAILVPYYEIRKKIDNIIPNQNQILLLYCQNGGRSIKACESLKKMGYNNIYNLKGGIESLFF